MKKGGSEEFAELFSKVNAWMAGELDADESKAVQEDLARPDSRIRAALQLLERAVADLTGEEKQTGEAKEQDKSQDERGSFKSRLNRGGGGPERT